MIESLKEEQRNELDEIEDEYNEKIQTFQRNALIAARPFGPNWLLP